MKKLLMILFCGLLLIGCSKQPIKDSEGASNEVAITYEEYNKAKEYGDNDGIVLNGDVEKVFIAYRSPDGDFTIKGEGTSLIVKYARKDFPNLVEDFEFGGSAQFKCVRMFGDWYLTEINNFIKNDLDAGKYAEIRATLDVEGDGISKEDANKLNSYCEKYEAAMTIEKALENNIYKLYPELNE